MTIFGLTLDQWLHFKLYLGLAAPLLLFLYLPLVLFGLLELVTRKWRWRFKAPALLAYLTLAYVVPLGDVTLHSMAMAKVCGKAGLHVYRTVKVEGVSMVGAGPDVLRDFSFRFIEGTPTKDGGVYGWRRDNGVIEKYYSPHLNAEWMFNYGVAKPDPALGVVLSHYSVSRIRTGEIIAEQFGFSPFRGWIDKKIGALIDNNPAGCWGGKPDLYDSIQKILIPLGESK